MCSKTISRYADRMSAASGLEELSVKCGGGAFFDPDTIVIELIEWLHRSSLPDQVHLQVLGDGFRAMRSTSKVSIGARLLIETEEEAGDTSFTAIASL